MERDKVKYILLDKAERGSLIPLWAEAPYPPPPGCGYNYISYIFHDSQIVRSKI